jgi:hypothetical protein
MAKTIINGMTRRQFVGTTVGAAAGLAFVATTARAQALDKSAVQYQEEPQGDQRCDNCLYWIPDDNDDGIGGCQMVKGDILPEAWCSIWAPQS